MGCSPSKGKLFPEAGGRQNALPAASEENSTDLTPGERENKCLADEGGEAVPLPIDEKTPRVDKEAEMALNTVTAQSPEGIREVEVTVISQTKHTHTEHISEDKTKNVEKRRKHKGQLRVRRKEKERMTSIIQTKVDFPPHMVRAHQAAYDYLNPNISKCDTLLGLLDQAAQTQLSLQPMMTALVLRFEEVNQALEEMAEEGELMLKEHGDYMAWPSGMTGPPAMPAKLSMDMTNSSDPPPDLLQQLLQHTTEKMKLVGSSIQGVGDNTLEEAVEYFASLSKLLSERLQAKRASEQRLALVLARVEEATMSKPNPEDSALHSEDSGIGGENESLTGSERHRRHRGSAGSGSTGSGGTVRAVFCSHPNNFPNHVGPGEGEEEEEEEDDEDEEEEGEEEDMTPGRKRSNSSPPDPSQPLFNMDPKYMQGQQPKRPLTAAPAARQERSSSTECVNMLLDLQSNQRDLDKQMKKMGEPWGDRKTAGPHCSLYADGLRRHSSSGAGVARYVQKGPLKTNETPCSLPVLEPQPPGRHSVRRLINTFSHGVDGRPGQSLSNIPPHIRRPRRSGALLTNIGNGEGTLVTNGNNNNNSWPEGRDDLDADNLPPPPPEVLMDNSFQSTEDPGDEDEAQQDSDRGRATAHQRPAVSQRLRASVQNVAMLPNRGSVRQRSLCVSPAHPIRQDAVLGAQAGHDPEPLPDTEPDPEKEQATTHYRQARKIIHLRNAAEYPVKRNEVEHGMRGPSPLRAGAGQRPGSCDPYETETYRCSLPVIAPPVSRVRLPPSCPSVHHRYPSPPAFRPQPTSRPSSRPGSPRILTQARVNSAEEIIPSLSFCDARSVFCQNGQQNSQNWTPSSSPALPGPWGESSRGRLPTRSAETSARRTQSEQRPSLASNPEVPHDPDVSHAQTLGCKPIATTNTKR